MSSIEKNISEKGFETNNSEFNKKYGLFADDVEEGRKILSDKLMNQILDFDEKANAKSNIAFLKNGKVHIALNNVKDPFAVNASDPEKLKQEFTSKISVITEFIDKLIEE